MKSIIKTSIIITLFFVIFQSCISDESVKEIIVDEQSISNNLSEKIIEAATHISEINDYNFFLNNAHKSCEFLPTSCYFNNLEGDIYKFYNDNAQNIDIWLSAYLVEKANAFNATGVQFTNDDFVLESLGTSSIINTREQFSQYFETCIFDSSLNAEEGLSYSDIILDCDNNIDLITFHIINNNGEIVASNEAINLALIETVLTDYNTQNNTNFNQDNVLINSILYNPINGQSVWLSETEDLINYFENCLFSRDISINTSTSNCLNFVYPLDINRFSLQLEEVITTTIENNEDLIAEFNTKVGELGFVYPIILLGQDGSILTIETNESLENALNGSNTYCN